MHAARGQFSCPCEPTRAKQSRCERYTRATRTGVAPLLEALPRPRLHLIRFHGVLAPHAKMRAALVPIPARTTTADTGECAHGHIAWNKANNEYEFTQEGKPATAFLFKLISLLQFSGTVARIDVQAYAEWLSK